MIYWLLLVFVVLFYGICRLGVKTYHPYRFNSIEEHNRAYLAFFIAVSVMMILIIGLKATSVGCDVRVYYNTYQRMKYRDYAYIFEPNVNDKGYALIQIFFNKIGWNFYAFNMLYAIFNISVISYLIYKKSSMPLLSYVLYIIYGFFVLDLTMIRQTIATSIAILAVLSDKNNGLKSFLKFEIIVFIAYLFHASAAIFAPAWFLKKIKINKKTIVAFFVFIILAFLFKSYLVKFVVILAGSISEKYASYQVEAGNHGYRLYFMILASVFLGIYLRDFLKGEWNKIMFSYMCMMLIIFPMVQGGGAIMRAYYYYYIFMIIYIPNMISGVNKNSDKPTYYLAIFLFFIVGIGMYSNSISSNAYLILPYKFFWQ